MIEKIASSFGNIELLSNRLESNSDLKNLVMEFCHTFDVKATVYESSKRFHGVSVLSNSGIPLGELYISYHGNDPVYIYTCEGIIYKDKASAKSDSTSRDSGKITSLIKTIKKNGEHPVETKIFDSYKNAIRDALNTVGNKQTPTIDVASDLALAMLESLLNVPLTRSLDLHEMQKMHKKYLKELNNNELAIKNKERFAKGCIVVKMPYRYTNINQMNDGVLVGEMTCANTDSIKNENIVITKPFERFDSLADSPIAGLTTMIRTYFEGHKDKYDADNVLGISSTSDRYFRDIDIAVASRNSTYVALIPLHAE
jgi:hypothetical protein